MGIRDSAQDTLGVMHTIPGEAKNLIVKLLQCQYTDGRAYHLFYPLTGEGGVGDAPIKKFDWYSDDHLWLILDYTQYDHTKGGITTYPPGAKENGGIFCHTNPWVMIAK